MAKKAKKKAGKSKKSVKKPAAKKAAAARKTAKPAARSASGLQSIAPGFTVNDAAASVAWYCDVLGFKTGERWENNGVYLGGEVISGNVKINLGQDDWKMGRDRVKGAGTRMYITTGPDIDQYADQIKSRGGTLAAEPKDEWGMRTFSINDPDGFKLTFMTAKK